ncbi:MAG: secreted protein, partial [Nocardioides sp.]|nr:secreted protein [Nocardioides sp.]
MRPLQPLLLTGALLGLVIGLVFTPGPAAASSDVRLDGVHVRLHDHTRQVVTVNRTRGHHARVVFWTLREGAWKARFRAVDGRIGYGGLVVGRKRHQGTGT